MITYDPKTWFKFIFKFHRSDAFRRLLPAMVALCAITAIFVYVDMEYLKYTLKNSTFFHQIIGFVLSMLLVFRINTAYDRWWEGRKQWGTLVNASRNLCAKLSVLLPAELVRERKELAELIGNYAILMKDHLRENYQPATLEFFEGFEKEKLDAAAHKPSYISAAISKRIFELEQRQVLKPEHMLMLDAEVRELLNTTGACERIRSTPIPYSYNLYLKRIIFLYVITMPFAFAIDFGYLAVGIVALVFYTFASLELLSEEIEDPFGLDPNDLPTDEIAARIRQNALQILAN